MSDSIDQFRPNSTVGVVMTAVVVLVLVPILAIEAPPVLATLAILAAAAWFFERAGVFDGDDESKFEDSDGDEAALDRLRRRYADGELSDDEFERRLDRLLETETLEDAKRQKSRKGERNRGRERDPERER